MTHGHEAPGTAGTDSHRPIRPLDPGVVERIAAGEVIERPASVARELIENALDAGATSIRIELREGGARLIRVGDDGQGIPADELALACAPHATSKLRQAEDLTRVTTFGFRGEALASIAAVAHLRVTSASDDTGLAATLTLGMGAISESGFEPRSRGTTVAVRDLFQTVPARRAALLSPRGEERLALAVIRGYALAHPDVRFSVITDGTVLLQTLGTGITPAVSAIYGADVARGLTMFGPVSVDGGALDGWIAPRAFTQADRAHILLCVNGRPVRNRALLAGLEAGYRPLLRKGRHPIVLAALTLDPAQVDVNIHPAKAEVLAHGERALAATLRETVHAALGRAPASVGPAVAPSAALYARARQFPLPLGRHRRGSRLAEPHPRYPAGGLSAELPPPSILPELEPLGQLDRALIVASTPDGQLYLVDQHRAHERLLYDALGREAAPAGEAASRPGQLLLEPLVIELAPRQAEVLASRIVEMAELGLACEPFGGSTFLVRALPAVPGAAVGPAAFASDLAVAATEDATDWRDHFRASLACRAALRRGQPLTTAEQRALLADLRGASATAACPHGSPLLVRYPPGFFARLFEWT